eukprot:2809595-Prymnesium_polylepis.1
MPGGSGGQFSFTMQKSADIGASSKKGGAPVTSSMTVQPTDQMSEAVVKPDIWMISGAIQYGVPTTELACVSAPLSSLVATPKLASFTWPPVEIRMLAPLMSRWMTPWSCRKDRPSRICSM